MSIENIINEAWEKRDQITPGSDENLKNTVNQIIDDLDSGKVRVAEKINGEWTTHQHIKKAGKNVEIRMLKNGHFSIPFFFF